MMKPAAILFVFVAATLEAQVPRSSLDSAMQMFWSAGAPDDSGRIRIAEASAAIQQVSASGASFDDIHAKLKAGRSYSKKATGRVVYSSIVNGQRLDNTLEVPPNYDPAKRWPMRVSLHGGVSRQPPADGEAPPRPLTNRMPGGDELVLHPRGWLDAEWWKPVAVRNLLNVIDRAKRDYNIDESRIYLTGISDGGSAVFFYGMREATLWSACLPLNGHPLVVANPATEADGQLYAANMKNCPLYAVNGGRDQLYPAASVAPTMEMFKRAGVDVTFQVYPDGEHNVNWWPQERSRYEAFLAAHPRIAHPESISWETERIDRYDRFRWLVIERLGKRGSDVPLEDVNTFVPRSGRETQLFDRAAPSGRVDVTRKGNAFEARTRGVQLFTLLLSPDVVDFSKPVRVSVNGRVVHEAVVKPDVQTLLTWASHDNDRTMLYGAALTVRVP
jgi:poly(3-hydroxybutyrate) depolymerase